MAGLGDAALDKSPGPGEMARTFDRLLSCLEGSMGDEAPDLTSDSLSAADLTLPSDDRSLELLFMAE